MKSHLLSPPVGHLGQRSKWGLKKTHMFLDDWLEAGTLDQNPSFQSFGENKRNQAGGGREGQSLNKTRILLTRELEAFQTLMAPNCLFY